MARILVADDDAAVRDILRRTFEADGYEVAEAPTGIEAMAICEQEEIDLAIIDLNMPEKGGLSTIAELRTLYPKMQTIVITGAGEGVFRDYMMNCADKFGAVRTFGKPFRPAEISEAVKEVLSKR